MFTSKAHGRGGGAGLAGGLVGAVAAWARMASNVKDAILAQAGPSATLLPCFLHMGSIPNEAMAQA